MQIAEVTGSGALGMHSGVPPEGNLADGAALNGVQIRKIEQVVGDLDGDGLVGITDFLMLLADWGACPDPCPPSCAADFDHDCTVGIADFLTLLANWS